jgi:hypothetical protein
LDDATLIGPREIQPEVWNLHDRKLSKADSSSPLGPDSFDRAKQTSRFARGSLEESIKEMLIISFIDGNNFRLNHLGEFRIADTPQLLDTLSQG